jgi:hypothetical protein
MSLLRKRNPPHSVVGQHSKEVLMRRLILALALVGFAGMAFAPAAAFAADDNGGKKPAGAAKGAAVGGLAGHEVGSGHAAAGAATGAAVGHHQTKKAEKNKQ